MSDWILRLIESKRAHRAKLAALPFEEKIKLLDQLRRRALLLKAGRRPDVASKISATAFE